MKLILSIILVFVLLSINTNAQWVKLDSATEYDNGQVFFVNDTVGYILIKGGLLLKTKNGGIDWDILDTINDWGYSMYFINENIGFITGGLGLKKTINGGNTWSTNSDFPNFVSIHFYNDSIGYAAGLGGIIKTEDQGITWNTLLGPNDTQTLNSIFMTDSLITFAFGKNGAGWKTTNGGSTWQALDMVYNTTFRYSFFYNSEIGYVIGRDLGTSILLKTIDAGINWQLLLQSQTGLSDIYFTDINTGYLVGGYIPGGSQPILWKTTDGGLTWTDQNPENNVSDAIYSIQFVNNCVGYAVGQNGLILKTINAGDSTLCKEPPKTYQLKQNYPNPFNNYTTIKYGLPIDTNINLSIYNILGQKVRTLVDNFQTAGEKEITWDGKDNTGKILSSGLYICVLYAGGSRSSRKMLFLK